jgi:hypothetical protein
MRNPAQQLARGLTLVEVTMAMLLVSVMLVAAMHATAGSGLIQYKSAERSTGRLLADGLIAEIIATAYEEPDSTPAFGLESGETSLARTNWDDVDDFNGWTESPPLLRSGLGTTLESAWERSVKVERVSASNPTQVVAAETGAKRITVTVRHNRLIVATRVAVRTKAP